MDGEDTLEAGSESVSGAQKATVHFMQELCTPTPPMNFPKPIVRQSKTVTILLGYELTAAQKGCRRVRNVATGTTELRSPSARPEAVNFAYILRADDFCGSDFRCSYEGFTDL
jgi:hypothetical protein